MDYFPLDTRRKLNIHMTFRRLFQDIFLKSFIRSIHVLCPVGCVSITNWQQLKTQKQVAIHRCSIKSCSAYFVKFSRKYLHQNLILNWNVWPATLLKQDSSTCVFMWILSNFLGYFFTERLRAFVREKIILKGKRP